MTNEQEKARKNREYAFNKVKNAIQLHSTPTAEDGGQSFAVVAATVTALRKQDVSDDEIRRFFEECLRTKGDLKDLSCGDHIIPY